MLIYLKIVVKHFLSKKSRKTFLGSYIPLKKEKDAYIGLSITFLFFKGALCIYIVNWMKKDIVKFFKG